MHRRLNKKTITGVALGLALVVAAPVASAGSSPQGKVTIPGSLTRIQYPGSSSAPTVYIAPSVSIPAWLARIQHPGSSSKPTVYVNGPVAIPTWLAHIQYPGSYSEATVLIPRVTAAPAAVVASAGSGFDWRAFGVGIAAAAGLALMGIAGLMALRRRRPLAHV